MAVDSTTVVQYYEGVLRMTPTQAQIDAYSALPDAATLLTTLEGIAQTTVNPVIRLYQAAFDRVPDSAGLDYWVSQYIDGGGSGTLTLGQMSANFTQSAEFQSDYGALSNLAFVNALYVNILQRTGDQAGIDYWTNLLNSGVSRGEVLNNFAQSPEFVSDSLAAIQQFQSNSADGTETYTGSLFDQLPGTTYTLTEAIALDDAGTLPATYKLSNSDANIGSNLSVAQEVAKQAQAQEIVDGAANSADLAPLSVTYTLLDTLANLEASPSVVSGASSYALSSAAINFGSTALTVAAAQDRLDAVQAIADGASNPQAVVATYLLADSLVNIIAGGNIVQDATSYSLTNAVIDYGNGTVAEITALNNQAQSFVDGSTNKPILVATYNLTDTLANLSATSLLAGAASYALSNAAGNLGAVSEAQADIIAGSSNAADYTFTVNFNLTPQIDDLTGTPYNDVFNAALGGDSGDVQTLNTFDSINGVSGSDTLQAVLNASVTPAQILNVQTINVQATLNATLGLDNAPDVTSLTNEQSSANLTVNNLVATATNLAVNAATGTTTINYVATAPSIPVSLTVTGVTDVADSITINGVDTVALTSSGSTANVVQLNGDGDADADALAITISGATNLTLTSAQANSMVATGANGAGYTGNLTAELSVAGTITGGTGNDLLTGTTGNDSLTGNAGNDTLIGSDGNDTLAAGEGNNTVDGGDDNDTITAGSGNDNITDGQGNNNIDAGAGVNTITAGAGSDTIVAGDGADNVDAGGGNDDIRVGAGNNTVVAGDGNDYVLTTTDVDSIDAGAGNDTVISGSGNDTITAGAGNDDINAGGDDDRIIFGSGDFNNIDSVNGGTGVNTLVVAAADGEGYTAPVTATVSNIQILEVSTAGTAGADLNVAEIASSITTVDLDLGSAAGNYTVTMNTGASTLNVGAAVAATGTLNVVQAGAPAAGDSITINNTAGNLDVFNNITSTGFETVTLNTGSGSTEQQIPTFTINASSASSNVNLNIEGSNPVDISTALVSNTTGLLTVDASQMVPMPAGTLTLDINAVTLGAGGTLSVTGSAGDDAIAGATTRQSTIDGGLGNDNIAGSTLADSLLGGEGADTITGGNGNDTVRGGAGSDVITVSVGVVDVDAGEDNDTVDMGVSLTEGDIVKGGAGTLDTLVVTDGVAFANLATYVEEFEVLRLEGSADALTQDMSVFANANQLNKWTEIQDNATGSPNNTLTLNNVGTAVTQLDTNGATSLTVNRVAGAPSTTLRVDAYSGAATIGTLDVAEEENLTIGGNLTITTAQASSATGTLNLDSDSGQLTITTLNVSGSLTGLSVTGDNSVIISNAIGGATNLATATSALTAGNLKINASNSTVAGFTFTGSATTGEQTVIAGGGNDVVNANGGELNVLTQDGADSITGSSGADTIDSGAGNDTISAAAGSDQIIAGLGVDSVTLTAESAGTGNDTITQRLSDSKAATATNFASPLVQVGDTLTFGNGVDVVTGFTAGVGGDTLNVVANGATDRAVLVGATVAALTSGKVYVASGDYNEATGVFTVRASGTGADTMIVQAKTSATGSTNLTTNESVLILKGVVDTTIADSQFVDGPETYTVTQSTTVSAATGAGGGTIDGGWTAATLVADGYDSISGDQVVPYTLSVNVAGGGLGAATQTFNRETGAYTSNTANDYTALKYLNVSTFTFGGGGDTYTTTNVGTGSTTVIGGAGTDEVVLAVGANVSSLNLGTSTVVTGFENINAAANGGALTATMVAGSRSYVTSAYADNVTFANMGGNTLTLDADAVAQNTTLTLSAGESTDTIDAAAVGRTDFVGDLNASALTARLNLDLGDASDDGISIITGNNLTTISGSAASDTVTIDADAIADGTKLTVSTAATVNISSAVGDTGLVGDLDAALQTGALTVALGDAAGNTIALTTGSGNTTVNRTAGTNDAVTINATAMGDKDTLTVNIADGAGSVSVSALTADFVNTGTEAVTARLASTANVVATNSGGLVTIENGTFAAGADLTLNGEGAFTVGVNGGSEFLGDAVVGAGAGAVAFVVGNVNATQSIDSARNITIDASDYTGGNDTLALSGAGTKTVTTGTGAFTIDAAGGSVTVDAAALGDGATLTLTDDALITGPAITINNIDAGDLAASTYAGNITIGSALDAVGGVADQSFVLGSGTNSVYFASANISSADTINGGAGNDTLYFTGNTDIVSNDLNGLVDINTVNFAHTTGNIAVTTIDGNFATAGTYNYSATALTSGTFNFVGTNDGAADEATYNISVGATGVRTGAATVIGGAGSDTITVLGSGAATVGGAAGVDTITTGSGGDSITGGTGADVINVGTGTDTINVSAVAGDTGVNTVATGPLVGTINFDTYQGMGPVDIMKFTLANDADEGAWVVVTSQTSVAGLDDSILFTQGDYDSVANTFTASASGADTLVTYDYDQNAGTAAYQSIILEAFVGSGNVIYDAGNDIQTVTLV